MRNLRASKITSGRARAARWPGSAPCANSSTPPAHGRACCALPSGLLALAPPCASRPLPIDRHRAGASAARAPQVALLLELRNPVPLGAAVASAVLRVLFLDFTNSTLVALKGAGHGSTASRSSGGCKPARAGSC